MTLRQIILPMALLSAVAVTPALAQEAQPQPAPAPAAEAPPAAAEPAPAAPTSDPAPAAAPAAKGTVDSTGRLTPPPAGKGQVVFFRPSNMMGMALSFSVHEGDAGIGKLGNGSYFVHVVEPGQHLFTIQSEVTDKLTLEVDAGETYYVKQTIGVGIVAGRPHLTPAEQAEFERLKLKASTKKPTDLKSKGDKAE